MRSRRALLGAALGAAAATVARAVAGPLPVKASTGHVGYVNNENGNDVIIAESIHRSGFPGSGKGRGVYGYSDLRIGVSGGSGSSDGVHGTSNTGSGVVGWSNFDTGVRGEVFASSGTTYGVSGLSHSNTGVGVYGHVSPAAGTTVGVLGRSESASGVGVQGTAPVGRGGQFIGAEAQIRLVPTAAASHPASGAAGDLYVDKAGRLWFCTTTGSPAVWKQVSLV
jgi:hypothetical protein